MELVPDTELVFSKPLAGNAKQTLTVTNSNADAAIAFKVKTTSPKQFCVRPNAGRLNPGESCEVLVILQTKDGAPVDLKKKDKFLIQAIKLDPSLNISDAWTQADQIKKSSPDASHDIIQEKKLKCVYVFPELDSLARANTAHSMDRPSVSELDFTAASSQLGTFQLTVDSHQPQQTQQPQSQQIQSPVADQTDTQTANELKLAKDRIASLQAACDGYKSELERVNMLRQRRADSAVPPTGSLALPVTPVKPVSTGVSPRTLLLLCLLSFLLGIWLW